MIDTSGDLEKENLACTLNSYVETQASKVHFHIWDRGPYAEYRNLDGKYSFAMNNGCAILSWTSAWCREIIINILYLSKMQRAYDQSSG